MPRPLRLSECGIPPRKRKRPCALRVGRAGRRRGRRFCLGRGWSDPLIFDRDPRMPLGYNGPHLMDAVGAPNHSAGGLAIDARESTARTGRFRGQAAGLSGPRSWSQRRRCSRLWSRWSWMRASFPWCPTAAAPRVQAAGVSGARSSSQRRRCSRSRSRWSWMRARVSARSSLAWWRWLTCGVWVGSMWDGAIHPVRPG